MTEFIIINPANEKIEARYPLMQEEEVANIILDVHAAQENWATSDIADRKKYMLNTAAILRRDKHVYAKLITTEMGKPITQSESEVIKCASLFEYYAAEGEHFLELEYIQTDKHKSYRAITPLGIILAIMPWNFPFWQVMRFAAPNLMLGNAGILKHAPNSTGAALAIEQLFLKAGFPKNVFRSIIVDVDLVPFIIHHPHVAGVTLTGSNRAGQSVAQEAGNALKKLVLELGGSDPYIILKDADIDFAAEQCITSRLGINAGQSCIAAKRLIVVKEIKKAFEEAIVEKAKAFIMGDPTDPKTLLGPLARQDLRDQLHHQVGRSIASGAQCALGGTLPTQKGFYYPATVLLDIPLNAPAFREELFGPVVSVIPAKDETKALHLANLSEFGLGSAIFTRDLEKGEHLARHHIQAGTCSVNRYVSSDPRLPFGGIKQSGYGRELALEGMREFANIKTVIVEK